MRALILIVLTTVALAVPVRADACSCMPSGPPCQAYFQSDAVFVGTVRSVIERKVTLEGEEDRPGDRRFVHLTIERIGRGVQGGEVDVWTGLGGGDCGFDFKAGQRYVVYAYRHADGKLSTGICSRTRLASEADEDLAYLSAVPATGSGARVFGMVAHQEADTAARRTIEYGGVPDVQVLVRGPAGVFSAITGLDGRYAINGVPLGAYEVEALPPGPFSTRYLRDKLEIRDARACAVRDFWLHYNGRVAGALVDASGRPAAGIRVDIAPVTAVDEVLHVFSADALSDSLGQFELPDIPPGQYVVGIGITPELDPQAVYPRTYFQDPSGGEARTIEVGAGNRVDAGTLRLPEPSRRYELRGVALGSDGSPIAGASVFLQGPMYRQVTTAIKTDGEGRFALPVFDGQSYTVRAYYNLPGDSQHRQAWASQTVSISAPPPPIRLVLVVR